MLLDPGAGSLTTAVNIPTIARPRGVAIGDLDGDGGADLVVAGRKGIAVQFGMGGGLFSAPVPLDSPYPGPEWVTAAMLLVRIREGAASGDTLLRPAKVTYLLNPTLSMEAESGGFASPTLPFGPARNAWEGHITIIGKDFIRGDANGDGTVDLSDAVTVLCSLFLGAGPIDCVDAADSDDSGALDITDPIFVLGVLFLGIGEIPPPGGACGTDPTADGIGCGATSCP